MDAEFAFSDSEKTQLLALARASVTSAVMDAPDPLDDFLAQSPSNAPWLKPLPCFVTLYTHSDRLRGCIGCLETDAPLAENVWLMARSAALRDPRFKPVGPEELGDLSVHLSILGPLQPLRSLDSLRLGHQGLLVRKLPKQGVLLAEVPERFGWTREEYLSQTFLKAGLDPDRREGAEVFYFDQVEFGEKT